MIHKPAQPMKEEELRSLATCSLCGKRFMATGVPILFKVTVEAHHLDIGAVNRQTGMEMMLGGAGFLATHLGPNEDMTQAPGGSITVGVCYHCAVMKQGAVAMISELATDKRTAELGD